MFQSKVQNQFYSYYPVVYIWDDHDFGDNNAGESTPGREAVTAVYLKNVPYYPLRQLPSDLTQPPNNREGIYQYFIAGQTLVIIMDLRTHFRQYERAMDDHQLEWVLKMLQWCINNDKIDNLILVSSIPWQGDDWVSFTEQRETIGKMMAQVKKAKQNVLLISGDSHMIAFDNGYNNEAGGFANCVSSPLDKTPSCKGGQYTYGPFSGNRQYSTLDITYDAKTKQNCLVVKGWRSKDLLYTYDFCNEKDRQLTYSNSCFTSVAQIFLVSILPLLFVVVILLLLWRYSIKFTNSLSNAQAYVEVPTSQRDQPNVIQNLEGLSSANKQYIPNTSFKGNSSQKLNVNENEYYANLSKSPSFPPNNSQNPIFNPSYLKNIDEKEINNDKFDSEKQS